MGAENLVWPVGCPDSLQTRRFWSLWEMMNFRIGALRTIQGEIGTLLTMANMNIERSSTIDFDLTNARNQEATRQTKEMVTETVEMARRGLSYLRCPHIDHAIDSLSWWPKDDGIPNWHHLRAKAIALRDAI